VKSKNPKSSKNASVELPEEAKKYLSKAKEYADMAVVKCRSLHAMAIKPLLM
jgi:hypothetical protein